MLPNGAAKPELAVASYHVQLAVPKDLLQYELIAVPHSAEGVAERMCRIAVTDPTP